MKRRDFVTQVPVRRRGFLGAVTAFVAGVLVPGRARASGYGAWLEEWSREGCGMRGPTCPTFTVVKTGEDERGAFVYSFRCDGCGDVSPRAFDHGAFHACAEWRERHGAGRCAGPGMNGRVRAWVI